MSLPPSARETYRPMTPTELRSLASNPLFEIGGHTVTHSSLPTRSLTEQRKEVVVGARRLEAIINKPVRSFSYPYGHRAQVTRDIVIAAGFECAVTNEHRRVSSVDYQFELPRRQVIARNAPVLY
jgi:peptidoglycan/xylan/chitin deacetylase (PgdA/CDA1 family)